MKSIHPNYSSICILVNNDLDFNDIVSGLRSGTKDHYKPGSPEAAGRVGYIL